MSKAIIVSSVCQCLYKFHDLFDCHYGGLPLPKKLMGGLSFHDKCYFQSRFNYSFVYFTNLQTNESIGAWNIRWFIQFLDKYQFCCLLTYWCISFIIPRINFGFSSVILINSDRMSFDPCTFLNFILHAASSSQAELVQPLVVLALLVINTCLAIVFS